MMVSSLVGVEDSKMKGKRS
ncbi:hypothetical protein Goarm_013047 [Gossypium armourianum]|uniref:Uncharacterized protein n=1 Tax=Gossypium armourianum TaxID=34283 RepID=A0A7J9J1R7_9ROSI|nr:hypothetical protein [Gossypium armourianum]